MTEWSTPPRLFHGNPEYRFQAVQGDQGRGFCIERLADGQVLSWKSLPKSRGMRSINLVGEQYRLDEIQDASFAIGSPLALVREPENPHDPNAVGVWNYSRTGQAGYLPADEVGVVARKLDAGKTLRCYSMWETWKDNQRSQIRALIVEEGVPLELPTDESTPLPWSNPRQLEPSAAARSQQPGSGCSCLLAALIIGAALSTSCAIMILG